MGSCVFTLSARGDQSALAWKTFNRTQLTLGNWLTNVYKRCDIEIFSSQNFPRLSVSPIVQVRETNSKSGSLSLNFNAQAESSAARSSKTKWKFIIVSHFRLTFETLKRKNSRNEKKSKWNFKSETKTFFDTQRVFQPEATGCRNRQLFTHNHWFNCLTACDAIDERKFDPIHS